MRTKSETQHSDETIPLVVVESHQHVLEHIHALLRHRARMHSRRMRNSHQMMPSTSMPPPLSMVHLDSHPDLACLSPHVPAAACYEPRRDWHGEGSRDDRCGVEDRDEFHGLLPLADVQEGSQNLYEYLDLDRSGIAQWILPLVLSGDLDSVHWVRSEWSHQICDGIHQFNVGAWVAPSSTEGEGSKSPPESFVDLDHSATMKVDIPHPYYYEDDSVVPTEQLLLSKKLCLTVSEVPSIQGGKVNAQTLPANNEADGLSKDWILDICLDYFVCANPFLKSIEQLDYRFASALVSLTQRVRFHSVSSLLQEDGSSYLREYMLFQQSLTSLLRLHLAGECGKEGGCDENKYELCQGKGQFDDFYGLYASKDEGKALVKELVAALDESTDPHALALGAMDALPSLSLPRSSESGVDTVSDALERVRHVKECLLAGTIGYKHRPLIVTVARSSEDGFTPKHAVDRLQATIIEMVNEVYCAPRGGVPCRCVTVFDYGESEGSTLAIDGRS